MPASNAAMTNKLQNPAKKGGVIQNPAKLPIFVEVQLRRQTANHRERDVIRLILLGYTTWEFFFASHLRLKGCNLAGF